MSTQLFVPNFRIEETLEEIRECLEKGWTGLGFKTQQIEEKWKEYTGLEHAHFLGSATVGLHLALHVFKTEFDWDDESEVLTTPLTFVSTNHAILYAGMKPVFCDIDEYLCIDPVDMLSRITEKTKAVIFVGLGGNVGQLERVKQICTEKGLVLILDAAHMAGTRLHGKHVGHDVDCTVFSFQAVKNLATADSGMICFNDPQRDERARKLTWLGINKDTYARTVNQGSYKWMYEVEELGFKYHGNSIMASMALVSLYYLDRDNSYRRQLAEWYREEIGNDKRINVVPIAPGCESSTHLLQIRVKHRDLVLAGLNELDIHPGVHYRDNTEYALYKSEDNVRQKSREASSEVLSLPMHMNVTKRNVEEIVNGLKKTLDKLDQ